MEKWMIGDRGSHRKQIFQLARYRARGLEGEAMKKTNIELEREKKRKHTSEWYMKGWYAEKINGGNVDQE